VIEIWDIGGFFTAALVASHQEKRWPLAATR
jgi:hypothetical protein